MSGKSLSAIGAGVGVVLISLWMGLSGQPAYADPHPGQSVNVVIIGGANLETSSPCNSGATYANGMTFTGGGCLPVVGPPGELGDFAFTAMIPSAVSAASLAPFDTAVLNVASQDMRCDTATLSAQQRAALVAFVAAGKKLIIFDSECEPGPVDYSWLPYPFTTANPGAQGAQGTLTIVEENRLSSNLAADPHYIDAALLGTGTDAVGDMNVMTTFDPQWCVDMAGTNVLGRTGPVHTYAKYPPATDMGLILYNGLDQDYQYFDEANIRKIWVQELQQPFNPSLLPCGIPVVGIALSPLAATNQAGTSHTVTATLTDLLGTPQPGILVTFTILSGPNAGASGTCSPNANCTSDATGRVSFTYQGAGGVGTDRIEACFVDGANQRKCAQIAEKTWTCAPPSVQILEPTYDQRGSPSVSIPIYFRFQSNGNGSPVVREMAYLMDSCVLFDGALFGDRDGLLADEFPLLINKYTLCQAMAACGYTSLFWPKVRITATNACGQTAYAERIIRLRLLKTEVCAR